MIVSDAVKRKWFEAVASIEDCVRCGRYGVQVAHRNQGKGMGMKTDPWMTAALCPECHHEIDNGKDMDRGERRAEMDAAIVKTHHALILSGKLKLG